MTINKLGIIAGVFMAVTSPALAQTDTPSLPPEEAASVGLIWAFMDCVAEGRFLRDGASITSEEWDAYEEKNSQNCGEQYQTSRQDISGRMLTLVNKYGEDLPRIIENTDIILLPNPQ